VLLYSMMVICATIIRAVPTVLALSDHHWWISGRAWLRICSYISTAHKHGEDVFTAVRDRRWTVQETAWWMRLVTEDQS